ncbi:hypothetical protein DICSQDRAFT_174712 [Dichomitus squalens LYAD-421 SS1]|uniref:Uncharacterized protein n=2 Tax=Dichomitus squalens TaxID=114155 RepID=A0A4Q9Q3G7_9APHY|nr:uncharacterized protein DICSQDRAFT_174712 [Dichomitus squalens LYAD-421 SS1]EJF56670.1 hypothetical protein DICSQDRAFT_174712 [Dichomitus squalens LYAD-421 SS1]TBU61833.1 hypothetical protein BD310DRAFT_148265 [Dichomitus squalens]
MPPHLSSLRTQMLPAEIIFDVVREAWLTIVNGDWALRWDFYNSISMVSHSFNGAMQNAALRIVAIRTPEDFKAYRCLVKRRWGLDPDYEGDNERVHPDATGFFVRSELHIVLADWICPGSGFQYRTDYVRIARYIPACKSLHVLVKELPSNDQYTLPYQPLFHFLSQYPDTRRMSLRWTYTHSNRYILPKFSVEGVTYLRVREFPRCICHNHRPSPPPGKRHYDDCFSYYLMTLFPNLSHLHIDTPYFLKNLTTPPNVTLVTIEVPPVHYSTSHGQFSSLSAWNIVSALTLGFFKTRVDPEEENPPPPRRRKIIVNTGPQEPQGWAVAVAACKAHNVELELRRVYNNPVRDK